MISDGQPNGKLLGGGADAKSLYLSTRNLPISSLLFVLRKGACSTWVPEHELLRAEACYLVLQLMILTILQISGEQMKNEDGLNQRPSFGHKD